MKRLGNACCTLVLACLVCCALVGAAAPSANAFGFLTKWGKNGGLGGQGSGNGEFVLPRAVAFGPAPGNEVFVVDNGDASVQVFGIDGSFKRKWPNDPGPGHRGLPTDIETDASGKVYVSDFYKNSILVYDANGVYQSSIGVSGAGEEGSIGAAQGFAVGPGGSPHVYIADSTYNRVDEFTAAGTFVRMWGRDVSTAGGTGFEICTASCKVGTTGSNPTGEMYYPTDVALNSVDGKVYVADQVNGRVQSFTTAGVFSQSFLTSDGSPQGIAADPSDGQIWVASQVEDYVTKYSPGGGGSVTKHYGIGDSSSDPGAFAGPDSMRVGPDGNLWVADTFNHRVQVFNGAGSSILRIGKNGGIGAGIGSAPGEFGAIQDLSARGGHLAVVDSSNYRIQLFGYDGTFQGQFGSAGATGGKFGFGVSGAVIAPNGDIYVSDYGLDRIQRFDALGNFIEAFGYDVTSGGGTGFEECTVAANCKSGTSGTADGQFVGPWGLAFGPTGLLYVADYLNHRVQVLDPANHFAVVGKFGKNGGDGTAGTGNGEFNYPSSVIVGPSGELYVLDGNQSTITKFAADGSFLTKWGSFGSGPLQFSGPYQFALTPSGQLHVADRTNDRVDVYDTNGNFLSVYGGFGSDDGQTDDPRGIAADESNNVYLGDTGNYRVQKFGDPVPIIPLPKCSLGPIKPKRFKGALKAKVNCDQAGVFTLTATAKSGKKKLTAKKKLTLAAGTGKSVTLKFSKKNYKKIRALVLRHKKPKLTFTLTGTTAGGNAKVSKTLRLKR